MKRCAIMGIHPVFKETGAPGMRCERVLTLRHGLESREAARGLNLDDCSKPVKTVHYSGWVSYSGGTRKAAISASR